MSDRELLEMAAKAAGIEIKRSRLDDPAVRDMLVFKSARNPLQQLGPWNPLADDGDALRLAVKLEMNVEQDPGAVFVSTEKIDFCEHLIEDRVAATRRAIVRAAAEIGRKMP